MFRKQTWKGHKINVQPTHMSIKGKCPALLKYMDGTWMVQLGNDMCNETRVTSVAAVQNPLVHRHKTSNVKQYYYKEKKNLATSGVLCKGTLTLIALKPWYGTTKIRISAWQMVVFLLLSLLLTFNFKQTAWFSKLSFPDGSLPHASKICQYLTISTRCQILTETASP